MWTVNLDNIPDWLGNVLISLGFIGSPFDGSDNLIYIPIGQAIVMVLGTIAFIAIGVIGVRSVDHD